MIVASNASPLIILAKLSLFDLPQRLFTNLTIAEQVWEEVVLRGSGLPGSNETEQALQLGWLRKAQVADQAQLAVWQSQYALGAGELATIILAKEMAADVALIDERRARLLATVEGVRVLGTVGMLELGYRRGEITDLRGVYQTLLLQRAHIDKRILNRSLADFYFPPI